MKFARMFDMSNDSALFRTCTQLESEGWRLEGSRFVLGNKVMLPLYEAKMINYYDHRYGDYSLQPAGSEDTELPRVPEASLQDPSYAPLPRYWVPEGAVKEVLGERWAHKWLLGWRDVTNSTNERTFISSVIPSYGVNHKFPLMLLGDEHSSKVHDLLAVTASLPFDYITRQKFGSTSMTYFVLKQLPVFPPETFDEPAPWDQRITLSDWIRPRAIELSYTSYDLAPFAAHLGCTLPPYRWDASRRMKIRCELDAAIFTLYGFSREDVEHVFETFPIARRKEGKAFSEYRSKRQTLEAFDLLANAVSTGRVFVSGLGPPPGDPGCSHSKGRVVPS